MKKNKIDLLWCIILGLVFISVVGCDKKSNGVNISSGKQQPTIFETNDKPKNDDKQLSLDKSIVLRTQIDEIENDRIKEIVEDKNETLENGIYGFIDNEVNKYYILINGVNYWYTNIKFVIQDKLLTVSYNTDFEDGLRHKQIFVINPNNEESFDNVELMNHDEKKAFKILYQ